MPPPGSAKRALSNALLSGIHARDRWRDRRLPRFPLPSEDPFYAAGEELAAIEPGTRLDSRPVSFRSKWVPVEASGWQLRFRSTDTAGEPISSVATLLVPNRPWPTGNRPLVSYQCAVDSLGQRCDPSYTLRRGSQRETPLMAAALRRGWAVVTSDYTGPRHAYGAGLVAARITLDGIRAALAFEPAALGAGTPVGAWGYSGGGQATVWAAEQHPAYAPEIRLLAAAAGGVPTDSRTLRRIDGHFFSGLSLGAAVGIDREYPETKLEAILNEDGHRAFDEIADMTVDELVAYFPYRNLRELTTEADPFDTDGARATIEALRLGKVLPAAPIYLYHSVYDQLVPVSGADELARAYRDGGVETRLRRTHLGEHVMAAVTGIPGALRFLSHHLDG
ncbi:MAG: lipase family protein [Acidimicrobiales bacterium]